MYKYENIDGYANNLNHQNNDTAQAYVLIYQNKNQIPKRELEWKLKLLPWYPESRWQGFCPHSW